MRLSFGCGTRHRAFGKMFRRVANELEPFIHAFGELSIDHPDYDALLIDITYDEAPNFFELVENKERYLQVLAGCRPDVTADELHHHLIATTQRIIRLCPLTSKERHRIETLILSFLPFGSGGKQQASD